MSYYIRNISSLNMAIDYIKLWSISSLYVYPIKSCAGFSVTEAKVTPTGLEHDREYMLIDDNGRFITQRQYPLMATIKTQLTTSGSITVSHEGQKDIVIDTDDAKEDVFVKIWDDEFTALKFGGKYSQWFTNAIGASCHLVKMISGNRLVKQKYTHDVAIPNSFVDGYPVHFITEASVKWIEEQTGEKIPEQRYRPNIVIPGQYPFDEDHIGLIKIGDVEFEFVKSTYRCAITQTDQETGAKYLEPIRYFNDPKSTRKTWNGVAFGQYLVPSGEGVIRVGDKLELLRQK